MNDNRFRRVAKFYFLQLINQFFALRSRHKTFVLLKFTTNVWIENYKETLLQYNITWLTSAEHKIIDTVFALKEMLLFRWIHLVPIPALRLHLSSLRPLYGPVLHPCYSNPSPSDLWPLHLTTQFPVPRTRSPHLLLQHPCAPVTLGPVLPACWCGNPSPSDLWPPHLTNQPVPQSPHSPLQHPYSPVTSRTSFSYLLPSVLPVLPYIQHPVG